MNYPLARDLQENPLPKDARFRNQNLISALYGNVNRDSSFLHPRTKYSQQNARNIRRRPPYAEAGEKHHHPQTLQDKLQSAKLTLGA